jgi:hypothetical protein
MPRLLAAIVLLPTLALAENPVKLVSVNGGDTSTAGAFDVVVQVSKGFYEQVVVPDPASAVTVQVTVDGCALSPATFYIPDVQTSGDVVPVARNAQGKPIGGYLWTVAVDVTACACVTGGVAVTHHCDGCGRSFDTCEAAGDAGCAPRDVTVTLAATNGAGRNACTTSPCEVSALVLAPLEGGSTERWVPENFWENDHTLCVTRSNSGVRGQSCKPIPSQGGESCAP